MVACIIRTAGLSVTFIRDGEELRSQPTRQGEAALRRAFLMLSKLDYLQQDDRLTVLETGGPNTPSIA